MNINNRNLFFQHLDWTESTCYYAAASHGCRIAYLAGPYRTSERCHQCAACRQKMGGPFKWRCRCVQLPVRRIRRLQRA